MEQSETNPAPVVGPSERPTSARGEVVLPTPIPVRVARRARYLAAVVIERRLAGPPIALGRRTSIVFGTRGVFVRGRNLTVGDGCSLLVDGELTVGEDVFFNRDANVSVYSAVSIGDRCRFGERLSIHDEDHNVDRSAPLPANLDPESAYLVSDIVIEDDVWVGANVTILRGSHIGTGAVVAAGAVVRGRVPSRTVVGGVPARVLKHLG